jgi:hypothetical protein
MACLAAGSAFAADPEPVAPSRNAQGQILIDSPAHLLYLSKNWGKDGAPRDGHYVMTADIDMAGITGFAPIGKDKENTLLGIFDGKNHAIRNLKIDKAGKKYVALFGYVGNDFIEANIKNLALLDIDVFGNQNVSSFAGVSYGTIENCFATGVLRDDGGSNAQTVGGIAGKNKEGEIVVGLIKNCYAFVKIEGSFNLGGIAGQEDGGGIIENCLAAGTILAKNPNGASGGIVGAFNAGQAVRNNVSLITSITGEKDTDKIIGQLADESGTQMVGNISWEGTRIIGNEPETQPVKWEDRSAADLSSLSYWRSLGWDFDATWGWSGDAKAGRPILKSFPLAWQQDKFQLEPQLSILSKPVKTAKAGQDIPIVARVVGPVPEEVVLAYGASPDGKTFVSSLPMKKTADGQWTASIPAKAGGVVYYYIKARAAGETVTKPWNSSKAISLTIDDGTIRGEPTQVVISLGEKQSSMRFNWMTVPEVSGSEVWYAKKSDAARAWKKVTGTSYIIAVTPGFNERMSHKAEIGGLEPSTAYVYKVGDGLGFMSGEYEFKSPQAASDKAPFTFIFGSDPQSVSKKDYETLAFVYDYALTQAPDPAFFLLAGDITQDGYKGTQWQAFFDSNVSRWASIPFMPAMGNHDFKGDPRYLTFNSRFNTPDNGPGGDLGHTVYCFEYGDAFIATLNTEAVPSTVVAPMIAKQLDWLEAKLAATDKKWKILQFHEGPYTSNHDPTYIRSLLVERFDKMGIDLVLSGHDHLYLRTTMLGDKKVPIGQGTTYVTGGTVGNKFYEYLETSRRWTEIKADEIDQQIVNIVTVSKDKIQIKAMQKSDPKAKTFKLIDSFEIDKALGGNKKGIPVTFDFRREAGIRAA